MEAGALSTLSAHRVTFASHVHEELRVGKFTTYTRKKKCLLKFITKYSRNIGKKGIGK